MRVALVFPPFYHPAMYNLPPLGLINLGTGLKQAGHEPHLVDLVLAIRSGALPVDAGLYRAAVRLILATEPELVAFSAQCTTYPAVVQLARQLKAAVPALKIAVGGHNASFLDRETLARFPEFDAVVRGEGEATVPELVAAWAAGAEPATVAGVTWRRDREIVVNPDRELLADLDALPLPDYALAPPLAAYREACGLPRAIAILEAGRGCPHRCVYCSESVLWRRRTRTFAVARVVDEMRVLRERHGAECFLLAYDQFTADRRYVEAFCRQVTAAGLNAVPWYCISRLDTVDADLLAQMRAAGCESMCYGIDSGSPRTLAFIDKRIDREILFERVRRTTALGMVPTLSFVIGFPEEERADLDATLELALWCGIQGNVNPLLQLPTVLPGTELYRRYRDRLVRGVDTYFALGLEFAGGARLPEDEALIAGAPELFASFYNLPCPGLPLPELHRLAEGFPLVVTLFPKSFLLLCRALGAAPSVLFADFDAWQQQAAGRGPLSAPRCFAHFPDFARARLATRPADGDWGHLAEVLDYEVHALAVARFAKGEKPGNIDLQRLDEWPLRRPANVRVAAFRFDLPAIVADLGRGVAAPRYPQTPSRLVFRQDGAQLEVAAIDAFGFELLARSDGATPLAGLAAALRQDHGAGRAPAAFLGDCRAAVRQLAELDLLEPGTGISSEEGR
ncbi:MAG: B12-binding domain-containing radical SAM protein [Deltaproteobacteria bacterium]|nr:MAG: B12-binding domain-containing radical SAM protein [Deltaproteobacteria bacterium]